MSLVNNDLLNENKLLKEYSSGAQRNANYKNSERVNESFFNPISPINRQQPLSYSNSMSNEVYYPYSSKPKDTTSNSHVNHFEENFDSMNVASMNNLKKILKKIDSRFSNSAISSEYTSN